jgi:hypothetical protein
MVHLLHITIGIFRNKGMKNKILLLIILLRLFTNDGFFNENRNVKVRQQPAEVRQSINRTWKKGSKIK